MNAPADPPAAPGPADDLFAQRASRETGVRVLVVGILLAVLVTSWPTEARKLRKRAVEYAEALDRRDDAAAYAMVSPRVRASVSFAQWQAKRRAAAGRLHPGEVQVRDDGTGSVGTTRWVRVEGQWYFDAD